MAEHDQSSAKPTLSSLSYRMATRWTGGYRIPLAYPEWLIDGVPLAKLLTDPRPDRPDVGLDLIPVLAWGQEDGLARLLLESPPDLPSGRYSLLVCPECGDPECGVASARIERDGELIVWRDLATEYPDYVDGGWDLDLKPWAGPFAFPFVEYARINRELLRLGRETFEGRRKNSSSS